MSLDLDDPRPRYLQVADDLRAAISRGEYAVGDRLPSGRQLAEKYEISHMTVKQALGVLRTDGVITSRQGVGAFVRRMPSGSAEPERDRLGALDSRLEALEARVERLESHAP